MKFPLLFLFASILLATFVFALFACAVTAELQMVAGRKLKRRH